MHDNSTATSFPPQLPAERIQLIATAVREAARASAQAAQAHIDLLDALGGDPDIEGTDAEDEVLSQRALDASAHMPGCNASDPGEYSLQERHGKQPEIKQPIIHEDAEDDSEDCDDFENEPLFDKVQCRTLNALFGHGPGGGSLLDGDYGGEELGERDEGECGHVMRSGIDQTKPISVTNPEIR